MDTKKPFKTYRAGVLSLNAWENEYEDTKILSFSFQKSYKDKEDKWQQTTSLKVQDLPKLRTLIEEAYRENTLNVINQQSELTI